jgi:hypothetical protein
MSSFITWKKYLLVTLGSLCAAAGTAMLLNVLLGGPRLTCYYDFLLGRRPGPPAAGEILLIDTEEVIEPGVLVFVLKTMTEFESGPLALQTPVLGFSPVKTGDEEEIRRRFDEEFGLLGRNIRNLFEAIRVGSVSPLDSSRYVEALVELADRGKERLGAALIRRDGAGQEQLEKAALAFGGMKQAGDLRPGGMDSPWYSRAAPDRDGRLRRIKPILIGSDYRNDEEGQVQNMEHLVYAILKDRYGESILEYAEQGPVLINRDFRGELVFPLDKEGALLVEKQGALKALRRLPLNLFTGYEEADRVLERALKEAGGLGIYSAVTPERAPLYLLEYSRALWEELVADPGAEKKRVWIQARNEYIESLDEFLGGPAETVLVSGYETLIASEGLGEEGLAKLAGFRDELIQTFSGLREKYGILKSLRDTLGEALNASFCIMGPVSAEAADFSDAEASGLLANTLLSGSFITPAGTGHILFWSLLACFIVLAGISRFNPLPAFFAGLVLSFLLAAGFAWYFVVSAYWIDPLIPAASCLAGSIVLAAGFALVIRKGGRRFRLAYGPSVGKVWLRELIRAARPLPGEILRAQAAVIALKARDLPQGDDPLPDALAQEEFRKEAAGIFKKAGAVVLGYDRDMVLACFGSPLERICLSRLKGETPYEDDLNIREDRRRRGDFAAPEGPLPEKKPKYPAPWGQVPPAKAAGFIMELIQGTGPVPAGDPKKGAGIPDTWDFGIDAGDCAFFWSAAAGYTALGHAVLRARILANLCSRYHARILITEPVREKTGLPVRRLHALEGKNGGRIPFYELPVHI